jgi:hypothetical protein
VVTGASGGQEQYVPQPLGVPYGYVAGAEGHIAAQGNHGSLGTGGPGSAPSARPPLYYEGDEYVGASRPPGDIANLQRALARVGLLQGSFLMGRWDDVTSEAFKALLSLANRQGATWEETLRQLEQQGGGMTYVDEYGNVLTGDAARRAAAGPLEVRVSDPATLRQTFREVATARRGQGFSDGEYDRMVAAYQAVERRAQEREYELRAGAVGDARYEVVNPPDPAAWAEEEVRRLDPSGVVSNDVRRRMDDFFALVQQGAPVQPGSVR